MYALLITALLPPMLPLLLVAAGLLWQRTDRPSRRHAPRLMALGLLLAWASASDLVVTPLARLYAQQPAPSVEALRSSLDRSHSLVLVLGGGIREVDHAGQRFDLKSLTSERLRLGVWWAKQLQLPLAFTGGVSPQAAEQGFPTEAAVAERVLREEWGLAPAWLEDASRNTGENARLSAPRLRADGVKTLLLVTHDLHLPRALRHFERELPGVRIVPVPVKPDRGSPWDWHDALPSAAVASRGHYLAYEALASLAGR